MAIDKGILKQIKEKSRAKLNEKIGQIPIGAILPDIGWGDGEEEIWYFRGATGKDSDSIMREVQTGNPFAASCVAIHVRCCNEDGTKRLFTPNQLADIQEFDNATVAAIVAYMGGYEAVIDDAMPSVEEAEKN